MPKSKTKHSGLLDTWGRRNRKFADKTCDECGRVFRPIRSSSHYCSRECAWKNNGRRIRNAESWWTDSSGYVVGRIWLPDGSRIHVRQHRFIAQGILGRPLKNWEDVHHKDGNKSNNDPINLEIIAHGEHSKLSNSQREYSKGYKLNLTDDQRKKRSLRAISMQLATMGRAARAAIAAATKGAA